MNKQTNSVRQKLLKPANLDDKDRMLLGILSTDATLSYAELGKKIALSAPAVHERVKRLRKLGAIEATVAKLNGPAIGRPLLAFVHVEKFGGGAKNAFFELETEPDVEEVHTVAGDTCILMKVRCEDAQALEDLLARIYAIEGVSGTRSYIALSTYLERGPQPTIGSNPPQPRG